MGRLTYEAAITGMGKKAFRGMKVAVASRTMAPQNDLVVLAELTREQIQQLRAQSKKDIWLFGGGELFRSLLELHEVDMVEVTVEPFLLGEGVKLLPATTQQTRLKLTGHRVYRSGIVSLVYEVLY